MHLCHKFYYIQYKWDPSTKPEGIKMNEECDTITLDVNRWACHNVFVDGILELNEIH